jgi:hypothetical protein
MFAAEQPPLLFCCGRAKIGVERLVSEEATMRDSSLRLPVIAACAVLLIAGCKSTPSGISYHPAINPADFVSTIDNRFLPLKPGMKFLYESATEKGIERTEVVVSSDTRTVMGVLCVVVWDSVRLNGELIEDTYDWYAQDRQGNVWYFGEDTKEYVKGKIVGTKGSWEAGVDGAQPGIVMKAIPKVGDSYRQEYFQGEAEDMAKVVSVDEKVSVPFGSFTGCLETIEWTPLEPDVAEYKFYAPGVGMVLVMVRGSSEKDQLMEFARE